MTKKTLSRVPLLKWCAILCSYQTKEYGDFKRLANKIELLMESLSKLRAYL